MTESHCWKWHESCKKFTYHSDYWHHHVDWVYGHLLLSHDKTESFIRSMSTSISNANCQSSELEAACRNDNEAFTLKFVAMASILVGGMVGIAIPLVGKHRKFLRTDGSLFVAAKAFAAGVILATGFVHILSGGTTALSDPCLPEYPWRKFPFAGLFAMVAALVTLLVEFVGTQYYERKQVFFADWDFCTSLFSDLILNYYVNLNQEQVFFHMVA